MEKTKSYWDDIEEAYYKVSIYKGRKVFERNVNKYPEYIGDLLSMHWFLSEFLNGGMSQFFMNPTAVVCERAIEGFKRSHVKEVAEALDMANRKFFYWSGQLDKFDFKDEEKKIYQAGKVGLRRVYDFMDHYALNKHQKLPDSNKAE